MKIKTLHLIFFVVFTLFTANNIYSQKAKTKTPPKGGFSKSTEANQPTGTPDYIVDQQANGAQSAISTPKKKKNNKKVQAKKSKEVNKATTNGYPASVSPNDAISYGISAPQVVKNQKGVQKERAEVQSNAVGDDKLVNTNNVKPPRKEAKKGGNLKGGIPPAQRGQKSSEQNQATGTPDYIVDQQSNEAQSTISTPTKKKNQKKGMAKKSKESNVANQDGNPYPPSPNDDVSYGITSPDIAENKKSYHKERSGVIQKSTGDYLMQKKYNIKEPREEAKRGGIKRGGIPLGERKIKSAEATGFQGNEDPKSEGQNSDASTSLVIPENKNKKIDNTHITKHQGNLDPKSTGKRDESSTSLVIEENQKKKIDNTHITKYSGNFDPKSTGKHDESSTSLVIEENQKKKIDNTHITKYSGNLDPKSTGKHDESSTSLVIEENQKKKIDNTHITKYTGNLDPKSTGKHDESSTSLVIEENQKKKIDNTHITKYSGNLDPKSTGKHDESSTSLVIEVNQKKKIDNTHITKYSGNLEPRSTGRKDESTISLVTPMDQKKKTDVTYMTKHEGDLEPRSTGKRDESSTAIIPAVKIGMTKKELGAKTTEMTLSDGDVDDRIRIAREYIEELNGFEAARYSGEISSSKLAEIRNKRKSSSIEMSSNVGDLEGVYQKMKDKEKQNAIKVRDYKGTYDYGILADRKAKMKAVDGEMGSNQGDIVGVYEKVKDTEKQSAIKVREYRGTYNYQILKDREDLRKQKESEIAKNTGDIIGSYLDMRNRWKESNKKIEDYRGKIDYDILKKNKDRMKELSKEMYSNTGDILTVSLEKKKSTLREKSRKATGYEGDMIVTKRTRSNHPSAVYIEARDSKSIEAKEKLRKQLLKKARKHREQEDPMYMRKENAKPRYDEREYQIWESKTREGDVGYSPKMVEDKKERKTKTEEVIDPK